MKEKTKLLGLVLALVSTGIIDARQEDDQPYAVPGRYIVVLKHGHQPHEVAGKHGLKPHHVFSHALHGFAGEISPERLQSLLQDPRVESIEPELELFSSAQTVPSGVKRIGAALSPMAKIDGLDERVDADIAILDTGIAPHPDLNIYTNVSFISGQSTDGNGHGTHVAGIAAALDNGEGFVGVAPGARLWAVKVMDDAGNGTTTSVIAGIDFVTQNAGRIEVANLSLAGLGGSPALRQAISNSVALGVVFVVSAGNDSRDVYGPDGVFGTLDDTIPAAYPEVMTVSALSDADGVASTDDALAFFSNYSRSVVAGNPVSSPGGAIDLAAPGVNISSTYLNGGYATMSGTSMAAPHVAGAAALYIAAHGRATSASGVAAIRQGLINLAQPQTAWGTSNPQDPDGNHEGLVYVANIAPPVNNPPTVSIAAPGNGSTFLAGSLISFSGSATDTESGNCSASLVWTSSIDGPIGTGGAFSRGLSAGTHTITATATDGGGKTGSSAISVVVQAAVNNPPTVTVITPTTGSSYAYNTSILFSGSASDVEDGTITTRLVWSSSINGKFGTGGSFYQKLSPGSHTITATVTDAGGKTASASTSVTIRPNSAPVVSITSPAANSSIASGSLITFGGSATDAEDGTRTAYLVWTSSIDGQIGTGGSFSRTLSAGTHTITATALDSSNLAGSASITVVVLSSGNNAPVVSISAPTTSTGYKYNSSISFSGSATDIESGNLAANLVWTSNLAGQIGTGASFSRTLSPGTHTITASVTDSGGKTTTASTVVTVYPNSAPTVSIASPLNGASIASGSVITFSGTSIDPEDGDRSSSLVWTSSIDGQIGTGSSFSRTLTVGTHTITARGTDSAGLSASVSTTITVLSPPQLTVSVSTDKSSYMNHNTAYINTIVTSGGYRIAGAAAHLQITEPDGSLVISDATTDADGILNFQYPINKRNGTGTYTIKVTASKAGYTAGIGTKSFVATR